MQPPPLDINLQTTAHVGPKTPFEPMFPVDFWLLSLFTIFQSMTSRVADSTLYIFPMKNTSILGPLERAQGDERTLLNTIEIMNSCYFVLAVNIGNIFRDSVSV